LADPDTLELLATRRKLAAELRRLRLDAGLSTHQLAQRIEVSQSKVSKIERGQVTVSIPDVRAWAEAVGVGNAQAGQLVALAEQALTDKLTRRAILRQGIPANQRYLREVEQQASLIREFSPDLIPGLFQTADYYRQLLGSVPLPDSVNIAEAVAARLDRQAVLHDAAKQFYFVLTEAAVRWRFGDATSHRIQLDRLVSLATLPHVHVAVIPLDAAAPVWHGHGFVIFDGFPKGISPFVSMETLHGVQRPHDPDEVAQYLEVLERLHRVTLHGEAASEFIVGVIAGLR
jgi:transcriptional regulator with XRE-family HTH domain